MLTTWPAFTEAMCLLGEAGAWRAQVALWDLVFAGDMVIAAQAAEQARRMRALMEQYRDLPMDLADASLVALAEERSLREIFTLDHGEFRVYRLQGRRALRLWPATLG